jgi:hypothetical protein
VLCWPEVKDEFVAHLKEAIHDFYGDDPKTSPDYGRIINRRSFDRLAGMISNGTVAAGGETDADELYIAPTVLVDVPLDSQIMREEVFGPILPVLEIDSVEKVIDWVNERPAPLGLYVFSEDESVVADILERTSSGDACVNDCALHPLVPQLPFGGVGNSGMGKYHGHWGFEAFTNARGVLYHSPLIDPGVPRRRRIDIAAKHRDQADVTDAYSATAEPSSWSYGYRLAHIASPPGPESDPGGSERRSTYFDSPENNVGHGPQLRRAPNSYRDQSQLANATAEARAGNSPTRLLLELLNGPRISSRTSSR